MSKIYDRNGLPLQNSYWHFLLGLDGGGTLRTKKAKKVARELWAEKDAEDAQAAKDAKAAAEAAEAAKAVEEAKAAEAAKAAEEVKKVEEVKAKAATEAAKWTPIEDKALLQMKSQGINCKDIGIIMGGKDKEVVRTRYKELMDAKDKENAAAGASESKEKKSKEKKVKEGKQKEEKRKDGKHKEDKGKGKEPKDNELKGILKNGKDKAEHKSKKKEEGSNGSPTIINVMIGDDDELNKDDLENIFRMNEHYDRKKWMELSSKLYDKTGKRVDPDVLARKLRYVPMA